MQRNRHLGRLNHAPNLVDRRSRRERRDGRAPLRVRERDALTHRHSAIVGLDGRTAPLRRRARLTQSEELGLGVIARVDAVGRSERARVGRGQQWAKLGVHVEDAVHALERAAEDHMVLRYRRVRIEVRLRRRHLSTRRRRHRSARLDGGLARDRRALRRRELERLREFHLGLASRIASAARRRCRECRAVVSGLRAGAAVAHVRLRRRFRHLGELGAHAGLLTLGPTRLPLDQLIMPIDARTERYELDLACTRRVGTQRQQRLEFGGALHVEDARLALAQRDVDHGVPVALELLERNALVVQALAGQQLSRARHALVGPIVALERGSGHHRADRKAWLPLEDESAAQAQPIAHRILVERRTVRRGRHRPEPGRRRHSARPRHARAEFLGRLGLPLALTEEPLGRRDAPLLDAFDVVLVLLHLCRQGAAPVGVGPALLSWRVRVAAGAEAAPLSSGEQLARPRVVLLRGATSGRRQQFLLLLLLALLLCLGRRCGRSRRRGGRVGRRRRREQRRRGPRAARKHRRCGGDRRVARGNFDRRARGHRHCRKPRVLDHLVGRARHDSDALLQHRFVIVDAIRHHEQRRFGGRLDEAVLQRGYPSFCSVDRHLPLLQRTKKHAPVARVVGRHPLDDHLGQVLTLEPNLLEVRDVFLNEGVDLLDVLLGAAMVGQLLGIHHVELLLVPLV